jgi:transposase InsO family protein
VPGRLVDIAAHRAGLHAGNGYRRDCSRAKHQPTQPGTQGLSYLLRNLDICRPNQVWGIDITYIRLQAGWMYLVAILDWFSRFVVAWELDQTLRLAFVLKAVDGALTIAHPEIWNSDQGSHFTSPQYTQKLLDARIQISMDGRGRAMDNVFTERLWRSLKYEEVYRHEYASHRQARQSPSSSPGDRPLSGLLQL